MRHSLFFPLLALASGFASLVYEIVWARQLAVVFGNSTQTASAVIAATLLGLAAGSLFFGRLADRIEQPLRLFAGLELAAAVYALLFPALLLLIQKLYFAVAGVSDSRLWLHGMRLLLAGVLVLPQMILLGGTLPALSKLFAGAMRTYGRAVSLLYGANTLGGVAGAFATGFLLLPAIGGRFSTLAGVGCNLVAVIGALALHKSWTAAAGVAPSPAQPDGDKAAAEDDRFRKIILIGMGLSGFCALGYEVLWTRMLVLVLGNSSWALSATLVAYLGCLGFGSLLVARRLDTFTHRLRDFAVLQVAIAVLASLSLLAFQWLGGGFRLFSTGIDLWQAVFVLLLLSVLLMLPATMLLGAVFPLAVKLYTNSSGRAGSQFGHIFAANTAGSVLGAVLSGFLLITALGIQKSVFLLALLNGSLGLFVLLALRRVSRPLTVPAAVVTGVVAAGLLVLVLAPTRPLIPPRPGYRMLYYDENAAATVTVSEDTTAGVRVLDLNNITEVATDSTSLFTFRLMAYLPYLLHKQPDDILVVTFGAGIVAGSLAQLNPATLECVELNPAARDAGEFFRRENHDAARNPNLQLHTEDGRHFLQLSPRTYDIITADATHPTGADSWVLFTREYYEQCRQHLNPGGLFLQWLPLHALSTEQYRTILATVQSVFPDYSIWFSGLDRTVGHTLLLASTHRMVFDYARIKQRLRLPAIRRDLKPFNVLEVENVLAFLLAGRESIAAGLRVAAISRDDRAITAYPDRMPAPYFTGENLRWLVANRLQEPVLDNVPGEAVKTVREIRTVGGWLLSAWLAQQQQDSLAVAAGLDSLRAGSAYLDYLTGPYSAVAHSVATYFLRHGDEMLAAGDTTAAGTAFRRAEILAPAAPHTYVALGKRYQKAGRRPAALRALKQATMLQPSGESYFTYGTIAMQLGQRQQALAAFRAAIRYEPDLAIAYANMGMVYAQMRNWGKAKWAWESALQRDPADAVSRRTLQRLNRILEQESQHGK